MRQRSGFIAITLCVLFALSLKPAAADPSPQTPQRTALLDRFVAVLPRPNTDTASARAQMDATKQRLAALNPGREAVSATVFDSYSACTFDAMHNAAPLLVRQAADQSLSDGEITDLIDFYSGPRYQRFVTLLGRQSRGEHLTREESRVVTDVVDAPTSQKFVTAMRDVSTNFSRSEAGRNILAPCVARLRDDIQANRLHWIQ